MKLNNRNRKPSLPDASVLLPTFYMRDSGGERTVIRRTVIANMNELVCVTPASYDYGYGKECVVSKSPTTVDYPYHIPRDTYVELHFRGNAWFNMYVQDFIDVFGIDPPTTEP